MLHGDQLWGRVRQGGEPLQQLRTHVRYRLVEALGRGGAGGGHGGPRRGARGPLDRHKQRGEEGEVAEVLHDSVGVAAAGSQPMRAFRDARLYVGCGHPHDSCRPVCHALAGYGKHSPSLHEHTP